MLRYSAAVTQNLSEFFDSESPLNDYLPGFQPRAGQAWMAEAVAEALADLQHLVVEAGTGTGKTFAYLLPVLLSNRKTIISTGTKALQDQLYHRDLPTVCKVVGRPVTTALLKGRANYLCLQRLETAAGQPAADKHARELQQIHEWKTATRSGDKAELVDIAEDSPVWPLVTSTTDNCLGQQCPRYQDCHVVKARRAAQEADVVVVNHHLLLADLAFKEEGFVEFLPGAEAIILDEAHQVPDLAAQFFGTSLGSRELEILVDELRAATLGLGQPELQRRLDDLVTAIRVLRAEAPREEGRHDTASVLDSMAPAFTRLTGSLQSMLDGLDTVSQLSTELEKLHGRIVSVLQRLGLLLSEDTWEGLRWVDINARSIKLNLTPLDVADTLRGLITAVPQAWVFTSATLAVGEDFSHFTERMGLRDTRSLTFPSPFPVENNSIIYLPPEMPNPASPTHTQAMLDAVLPLLKLTQGGMFCLFTSHRALAAAAKYLRGRKLGGRALLVQGKAPRDELLRRFREKRNAVLLGTSSFWEGVDVRGSALSIVAIDKLPFASPGDPLMMARLEFIRRRGGNGFAEHQLPQAVLALKQGVGRLLRDPTDFGVIVLCDPRLSTRNYGAVFLNSLLPMQSTDSMQDIEDFFARHAKEAAGD